MARMTKRQRRELAAITAPLMELSRPGTRLLIEGGIISVVGGEGMRLYVDQNTYNLLLRQGLISDPRVVHETGEGSLLECLLTEAGRMRTREIEEALPTLKETDDVRMYQGGLPIEDEPASVQPTLF